jgi:hypothetical protein
MTEEEYKQYKKEEIEEQEKANKKKLTYEDHWDAFWNNDKSK